MDGGQRMDEIVQGVLFKIVSYFDVRLLHYISHNVQKRSHDDAIIIRNK